MIFSKRFKYQEHPVFIREVRYMKDSKGNAISIGDRILGLWGPNNEILVGKIVDIRENYVTVASIKNRMTMNNPQKMTKISPPPG